MVSLIKDRIKIMVQCSPGTMVLCKNLFFSFAHCALTINYKSRATPKKSLPPKHPKNVFANPRKSPIKWRPLAGVSRGFSPKNKIPWLFPDNFRNFQPSRQNFRSKNECSWQKLDEVQKSCHDKFSIKRKIFTTKSARWPKFLEKFPDFPRFLPIFCKFPDISMTFSPF